jgi:hypothetical protein
MCNGRRGKLLVTQQGINRYLIIFGVGVRVSEMNSKELVNNYMTTANPMAKRILRDIEMRGRSSRQGEKRAIQSPD